MPTPRAHLTDTQARERAARRARFGERVRELRKECGMTQEQVALASGIDRPFLVQVENGRRSVLVERLEDLASALGVPVADLFPDGG